MTVRVIVPDRIRVIASVDPDDLSSGSHEMLIPWGLRAWPGVKFLKSHR